MIAAASWPRPIFSAETGTQLTVTILPIVACLDGLDNDGDGKTDFPADPGCVSDLDNSETDPPPPSSGGNSGGGGGGGGGFFSPPPQSPTLLPTVVKLTGRAYPKSTITVLKDAQVAATTIAGDDARFTVALTNLSSGNYILSVYAEDGQGNRSSLFTFPIGATAGATTEVGGIFLPPTISLDKLTVKRGDNLTIFGKSAPESEITVTINSAQEIFAKTTADQSGVYSYTLDTAPLDYGNHLAKTKAAQSGAISAYSAAAAFTVGTITTPRPAALANRKLRGDINNDNRVNLVDFSILAYWYKRPRPRTSVDLNGDSRVDLKDFSILAFNWTG